MDKGSLCTETEKMRYQSCHVDMMHMTCNVSPLFSISFPFRYVGWEGATKLSDLPREKGKERWREKSSCCIPIPQGPGLKPRTTYCTLG